MSDSPWQQFIYQVGRADSADAAVVRRKWITS